MFCVFLRIALRNNIFPTHLITINTYRQWVTQQNWWFIIDFPRKKINQLGALGFDVTMSLYRGQISRKSPNKMICRLSAQKIQKDAYAEEIPICVIQVSTLSLIPSLNICQNLILVKTVLIIPFYVHYDPLPPFSIFSSPCPILFYLASHYNVNSMNHWFCLFGSLVYIQNLKQ